MNELENALIEALLKGNDPILKTLRQQIESLTVEKRDFTGVGFFTHLGTDESVPRVKPPDIVIRDVLFEIKGLESGAMAMLFVREGIIDFLEVVTFYGDWPDDAELDSIQYMKRKAGSKEFVSSKKRDMSVVREYWET